MSAAHDHRPQPCRRIFAVLWRKRHKPGPAITAYGSSTEQASRTEKRCRNRGAIALDHYPFREGLCRFRKAATTHGWTREDQ
jgi:hypothetical protein